MRDYRGVATECFGHGISTSLKHVSAKHYAQRGAMSRISDVVQCEGVFRMHVNNELAFVLTCSDDHLPELAVGHLLTEGVIGSFKDVLAECYDTEALEARMAIALKSRERRSDSGAGLRSDFVWRESWIYDIAREFAKDKTAHARTRGCHSAYLMNGEHMLCMREDIGRHNAVDKVVGWAVRSGIDLSSCWMYLSGRVPADMVLKAIRAQIPLVASKSVTTDKAIEMACAAGLVLLCEALPDSFEQLSGKAPLPTRRIARAV